MKDLLLCTAVLFALFGAVSCVKQTHEQTLADTCHQTKFVVLDGTRFRCIPT